MPLITIFTPTYNRANLLTRLYNSLCEQTCKDFEWLIVDDGSTDDTEKVVTKLEVEANFPIVYIRKTNGGKHTAVNLGVKRAKGELFLIADSDDALPPDAIKTVIEYWEPINKDKTFAGVCGLDAYKEGNIIGSGLPCESIDDNSINIRFKLGITGDMKEVFRTDVLREFPFPEIKGEKFCPEMLVWNRIATKYKLRFINKIIYNVEYQPTGLSANIIRARMQSPIASTMTYQELTTYKGVPLNAKIRAAINYWRFRFCIRHNEQKNSLPRLKGMLNFFALLGLIMHWIDKIKVR